MSEIKSEEKVSLSRRRPTGDKANVGGNSEELVEERAPRTPRVVVPLPLELVGKTNKGIVSYFNMRGPSKFGFIYISDSLPGKGEAETLPRVYFKLDDYHNYTPDTKYYPRRGYEVQFEISKDETDRFYAVNIRLTDSGVAASGAYQAERAVKIAVMKESGEAPPARKVKSAAAAKQPKSESDGIEKKKKPRRNRKPREKVDIDTLPIVNLVFTCEGKAGEKTVEARIGQNLGTLKYNAAAAFEASNDLSMYKDGSLLTRTICATLKDGDRIQLATPTA